MKFIVNYDQGFTDQFAPGFDGSPGYGWADGSPGYGLADQNGPAECDGSKRPGWIRDQPGDGDLWRQRLVFVNTYGSGVSATFRNEIVAAENYLQSHFHNACTLNCSFDLQSINPSFSGENFFTPVTVSYASLRSALQSHATSPDDLAAVAALANLPDPSGGNGFEVPSEKQGF